MPPLRIVFMGTAGLACPSLEALAQRPEFRVVNVVTQPDRPRGRNLQLQPTPIKERASSLGLPVMQPERLRHQTALAELAALQPDLIVVAAYGQILPPPVLNLPRLGCLNVHASLLPRYRGAAPIQWAILNGDAETGVTIMRMDAGLDTGDILAQNTAAIATTDDARTLNDRLAALGARLLIETIPAYVAGKIHPRPQPADGATYARKILKEDGHLDWQQPARILWYRIRAFSPWPGAFTFQAGRLKPTLLKICRAEVAESLHGSAGEILRSGADGIIVGCGQQALRVLELQREGGKRLAARDFLAGHGVEVGEKWS